MKKYFIINIPTLEKGEFKRKTHVKQNELTYNWVLKIRLFPVYSPEI